MSNWAELRGVATGLGAPGAGGAAAPAAPLSSQIAAILASA